MLVALAVSCTKTPVPESGGKVEEAQEYIPAREFDAAMLEAVGALDLDFDFFVIRSFVSEAVKYDPEGLLRPLLKQILAGQLLPTGHFTADESGWNYSDADDLKIKLCDEDGFGYGIKVNYNGKNRLLPRLPESTDIRLSVSDSFVSDSTVSRFTILTSADSTDSGRKAAITFKLGDENRSLFYISNEFGTGWKSEVTIGIGERIKFAGSPLLLTEAALGYFAINRLYRNSDKLVGAIDEYNRKYSIPFYLDNRICGNLALEAFEENGDFFADFVLEYPTEGTSYCIQFNYFL